MRYVYSENEPIEKHPQRTVGDPVAIINKITGMPDIAMVADTTGRLLGIIDNQVINLSPYYWEIAWP